MYAALEDPGLGRDFGASRLRSHHCGPTGYRVDSRKLGFLSDRLPGNLNALDCSPALSPNFGISSAGLSFAGMAAARTFGLALRFVQGAAHPTRCITQHMPPSSSPAACSNRPPGGAPAAHRHLRMRHLSVSP